MPTLRVNLPRDSYDVLIEPGALRRVGEIVRAVAPHQRALLVVDCTLADSHGRAAAESLRRASFDAAMFAIEADEARKTLDTVREMYQVMLESKFERGSPVIALGGGIVGDVAGFAAATYQRGVPLVQVPTTLLAMVDAAIGGKTGVNVAMPARNGRERSAPLVKNMVGAFWQPRAVVADPEALRTLPPRELRCGLAECIKHAVLGDAGLLDEIERHTGAIASLEMDALVRLIVRSAAVKIAIVQEDERESGRRALLNLGHTFAHAIESVHELGMRHGEAVAIGLCAAAACARRMDRLDPAAENRIVRVLASLQLPVELPHSVSVERLLIAMRYDKKVSRGSIRLVLPRAIGAAELVNDAPDEIIRGAWEAVGAQR